MKIVPVNKISSEINLPGDKSISHRAVMLGAIAEGRTRIKGFLDCDDCQATVKAFRDMGVAITKENEDLFVNGRGLKGLKKPSSSIDAGESGTTMRLLAGILAGQPFAAKLVGAPTLAASPMDRIVEPLTLMGVDISATPGGKPPLVIKGGRVTAIDYELRSASAQVKSAILFAGLYADGVTTVTERFRSRDHTERMMGYFGADVKVKGNRVALKGPARLIAKPIEIPADISSASFFLAGAVLLKGSRVTVRNVSINPTRAGILDILSRMKARITIANNKETFEPVGDITAEYGVTEAITIEEKEVPSIIDELPVIFVLASLSRGKTVIRGAGELRVKETDRIRSMTDNLRRMGADIEAKGGDITISGVSSLKGASLSSFGDHRTCMAMTIAALAAKGESNIDDTACVSKSFPGFFEVLAEIKR